MASVTRRSKSGGSGRGGIGINNTSNNSSSRNGREDTAKSTVAEQISQAVHSTSNLLHLMQLSSSSHAQLTKLPKNLLAKAPTIKNTGLALEQMPHVISSLDAHLESGLDCLPHLKTVTRLLVNMESCQLNALSRAHLSQEEPGPLNKSSEAAN